MATEIQRAEAKPEMNVLVTFDEGYVEPFKVLVTSVVLNNPGYCVRFLLVHSDIGLGTIAALHAFCLRAGADFASFRIDEGAFGDIPVTGRYPLTVYYRLLAAHVLPASVERVIYLDCDMLVINPLAPLWEMDLMGNAFAAASHSDEAGAIDLANQARLGTTHGYFNTGVLVIDTAAARKVMTPKRLSECAESLGRLIVLPDQDVFNVACGGSCLVVDDELWNYDARGFVRYKSKSLGDHDLGWVMGNTAILHFCGPRKPWKKSYSGRFAALYRHYMQLAARISEV